MLSCLKTLSPNLALWMKLKPSRIQAKPQPPVAFNSESHGEHLEDALNRDAGDTVSHHVSRREDGGKLRWLTKRLLKVFRFLGRTINTNRIQQASYNFLHMLALLSSARLVSFRGFTCEIETGKTAWGFCRI